MHADLAQPENPLVYLGVLLPQLVYLAAWRRFRATVLLEKSSYATLGYMTVLARRS